MKVIVSALLMIALAVTSTAVFAARIWDGSAAPTWGYAIYPQYFTYDYNGLGYTRQVTGSASEAFLRFDAAPDELVRANGWFVEARLKVTLPTNYDYADCIITLGDDVGGGYLIMSNSGITCYVPGQGYGFDVPWIADDWNIVRATMPAGGTDIQVDVNGTPAGSFTGMVPDWWYTSIVTIGDWGSGGGSDVAWDYLSLNYGTSAALTGNITLEDYVGSLALAPVLVQLVPTSGGAARTETIYLGTGGSYSVSNVAPGTYDVYFSACQWLTKKVSPVVVMTGPVDVSPALKNGDSNGDNEVNSTDLSVCLVNIDQQGDSP